MSNIKLIVAFSAMMLLAACGGGSDNSPTPAQPTAPPKTIHYTPVAPRTGDSYYFSQTSVVSGISPNIYNAGTHIVLNQIGNISPDGSHYVNKYLDGFLYSNKLLDTRGDVVRENACTFSPALDELPIPLFVGQTFSQTSKAICPKIIYDFLDDTPSIITTHSQVQAYESVTVAAGKFNTLKISSDTAISFDSGVKSKKSETCWVDVMTGASVKCHSTVNYDYSSLSASVTTQISIAALGGKGTDTNTLELTAIKHAADFPFSLTAAIDGAAVPGVYTTPIESLRLVVEQGKTLTLNASTAVSWSIQGTAPTDTPMTLTAGNQVITVDGYTVNISVLTGKLSAKVTALPSTSTGSGLFILTGSSLTDLSQHASLYIAPSSTILFPTQPVVPDCLGLLKFC